MNTNKVWQLVKWLLNVYSFTDLRIVTFWTQMKKMCSQFDVFVSLPCCQLAATGRKISDMSSHAQTRLARPLSDRTQMRTAQDMADDLSFFLNNTYILLRMYYWCKIVVSYYAVLKIRNNAEIVCHEQTVMTRVAGDIQSSSRRNSSGRQLVLKPLS